MHYQYLVVGAGLFGAVFASEMTKLGKNCLVIEKRNHIAGNIYTKEEKGIQIHQYGAHIFHTSDKEVWDYVNTLAEFNHYINSPVASYKDELYNLPFNMNTFAKMWNIKTPKEAKEKIQEQIARLNIIEPQNLEEQALSLVGTDIYEKLVKGYTEKQWGRDCKELPAFIIKRLPVRFVYDNNYFNDPYQGIPKGGYTGLVEKLLDGITVKLNISYEDYCRKNEQTGLFESVDGEHTFEKILYTGMIDEFYHYQLGELSYRSLRFETEVLEGEENYQGNAVVNYTEREVPYTRIIEHKHFEFGKQPDTVITREYPQDWEKGQDPYYPVNDDKNSMLYEAYAELAKKEKNVLFGGRLGQYKYYDMDKVIRAALNMVKEEMN
ncbi:MAG: UDP-galactopyranose mutase [Lachnospiraceae bacterium]|nr:UDP-galactopyranose mutase [Lachnospiraceae bacterium]